MCTAKPIMIVLAAVTLAATAAPGGDIVREAVPQKWIEPHLPEDLPPLEFPAYYDDLDKARAQAFAGRYRLALATLHRVRDADPVEVALIRATVLAALGREDEALQALSEPAVADEPRVEVTRAEILAETGQLREAINLLDEHLARHPASIAGYYHLGALHERLGDFDAARGAYAWFVDEQRYLDRWQGRGADTFDDAEQITLIARALDRWATLNTVYPHNRALHNIVLNMFVQAYDVIDRGYWPAHVAAAEYFLSHDNAPEALNELQAAQRGNPNDIRSLRLIGVIALEQFDFDRADAAVAAIRKINPHSIQADLLEARNLLLQRRPHDAAPPLQRVLSRQPEHLEALGLLAATYALQLRDDQAAEVLRQVERIDPNNATAYYEIAEQLAAMRQYPRSAEMYEIAIERAPWWTAPRNGLGLLHTQSGDEEMAHIVLDAAHALDPFNLRTTNYLRLLDNLLAFDRKETDNFVILYDGGQDPFIAEFFAEYLESIYDDIVALYDHKPQTKTLIEIFPTHDAFSVRTTGSPWIGTVGASTGPVIALVAPRPGRTTMGPFNWAEVLRHEFVHTVTLSATENRIAHWMTEGLAVMAETEPMQWEWGPLLYHAVTNDDLFTMENITWGFIRPRRPIDRTLAYAQSYWICKYIRDTWGHEVILTMMEGFRDGRRQEEIFAEVLGMSQSQFTESFFAWAGEQVAQWGYDAETTQKYEELRDRGETLIRDRQFAEALPVWQEIAELRPMDPLSNQRLAGLYLTPQINQPEQAAEHLITLHRAEVKDNRYAKRIARLYRDMQSLDDAVAYAVEAVHINPYDLDAHQLLAQLYDQTGEQAGLERQQRIIAVLEKSQERN